MNVSIKIKISTSDDLTMSCSCSLSTREVLSVPWLLQAISELEEVVSSRTNNLRSADVGLVPT